jgi:hypothetical protein
VLVTDGPLPPALLEALRAAEVDVVTADDPVPTAG